MLNNKNKKRNTLTHVIAVLVLFVIISLLLTSFVLARYATTNGSEGTVSVNIYSVTANLYEGTSTTETQQFNISASGSTACSVKITNASAVSIDYSVTLTNETQNLPLKLSLSDSNNTQTASNTVTLSSSSALASGSGTATTATITISITLDSDKISADSIGYNELYREIDRISVTVVCTQAS